MPLYEHRSFCAHDTLPGNEVNPRRRADPEVSGRNVSPLLGDAGVADVARRSVNDLSGATDRRGIPDGPNSKPCPAISCALSAAADGEYLRTLEDSGHGAITSHCAHYSIWWTANLGMAVAQWLWEVTSTLVNAFR